MSVLRFKDLTTNEWKEITTIRGATGPQGPKGNDGNVSFEELTDEQKEQLRGPQGIQGPEGPKGDPGDDYILTNEDKTEIINTIKNDINFSGAAEDITYDNTNSGIENINTVQKAIDHLIDTSLDAAGVENILEDKGYQTEAQVIALISEYGGGGESLPAAEEVGF